MQDGVGHLPAPATKATPLRIAILATIIQRPAHVYDVAQRFEHQFGRELSVTLRRVYQVVEDLLAAEIVEELPGQARQGTPRRTFGATDAGRVVYQRWLIEKLSPTGQDAGARAGLSAALMRGRDGALDLLGRYEVGVRDDLAGVAVPAGDLAGELLAEHRRIMLEAALKWAALARERLSSTRTTAGVAYAG